MADFTLDLQVSAGFISSTPTLEILLDGSVVSADLITAQSGLGTQSLSYTFSFTGSNPSSLSFRFNDALGEAGRSIKVEDIRINSNGVSVSQMTLGGTSALQGGSITLSDNGDSTALDMSAQAFLFGLSENEPTIADFDPVTMAGTAARDNLTGTAGDDVINADADDDAVRAGTGNDQIHGGAGVDKLFGEDGDDLIAGGAGNDRIYGGEGADTIYGGEGDDAVVGEAGDDIILGNAGNDRLHGDEGNDALFGGSGNDRLDGDIGNDYIDGGADNDRLYGSEGDDTIVGGSGDDYIYGDADNDNLSGDEGRDFVNGGTGDDVINGGAGNDTLYGGEGIDTINGDSGNDLVYAGEGIDTIDGGTGNDKIYGDAGDDNIVGGAGNDRLFGGIDNDTVSGGDGSDFVYGNDGDDTLYGGAGARDELFGGAGADIMYGGAGFNKFFGGNGNDQAYGDADVDVIRGDNGDDLGYGYAGDDILVGGAGNDTLYGGDDNDILRGNDDNDLLYGEAGDDEFNGGNGDDLLDGDIGNDTAIYTSATTGGVTVDLNITGAQDTINAGVDTLVSIENIVGSLFNDTLIGDANSNEINGQDGDDKILGTDGQFVQTTIVESYGGQDFAGTTTQITDGVTLDGNNWKKTLVNYTVTANTVIEFDFSSNSEGEIHGIGFDNDDNISQNATFKLYGTQTWGRNDFETYDGSGDVAHFTIDVGSFYTGTFSHLFLVSDDDANSASNSSFTNITIYEAGGSDADAILGGDGDDNIYGGGGADTLEGGIGSDLLSGSEGIDTIYGISVADSALSSADAGSITTLESLTFNAGLEGLVYSDGGFGGSDPTGTDYARGSYEAGDGDSANGSAEIILGGVNNDDIDDISGNFQYDFTLGTATTNTVLSFSYRAFQTDPSSGDPFDNNEDLQLFAALDGTNLDNGTGNGFYIEYQDPDNGFDTGWVTTTFDLGALTSGAHTLNLGGLITRKTFEPEEITLRFDDLSITTFAGVTPPTETNIISGGAGADLLYGSTESDIFAFEGATAFDGIDVIENFNVPGGDAIDIRDVLEGFDAGTDAISDFVQLTESGGNTTVSIDANGAGGYTDIAVLNDITGLSAEQLLATGSLIV